jgi:uncharacterized protein with von Willebrand factor type A (vWA) domain
MRRHFSQPPHILGPVLCGKPQIRIQAATDGVAIKQDWCAAAVEQMPLQSARQGRFAGGRKPREPDHRAAMRQSLRAFIRGNG